MNELTTDQEKDQSKETFYKLRDEEIRAVGDSALTHGAARLFILISKLVWFPNYGGMFKGMTGALKCSVSDLARYMGCNQKSFYRDGSKNRAGWLELLTAGNYIWITKHTISNGEAINVYHITAVRPRSEQSTFGFSSRFHDHPPTGENGNGVFSVSNGGGNSELAKTVTEDSPKRVLGTGENGNSPLVKTVIGSGRKRELPITPSTSDPLVKTVTANYRLHQRPTGENGNGQLVKTGEYKKSVIRKEIGEGKNGGVPPPDLAFERWVKSLDGQLPSRLHALERKIKDKLASTSSPAVREGLKRQLKAVEEKILPTIPAEPTTKTAKGVKLPTPSRMSPEQLQKHWNSAKKISPELAAAGA